MEQINVLKQPYKIQLDSSHEKLQAIESRFLKNTEILQNANTNNNNQSGNNITFGGNAGNHTPTLSIKKLDNNFTLPNGLNKSIGAYECVETNETYWFVWNEYKQHTVNVIYGENEKCQTVFKGECLGFDLNPAYAIAEHKVFLKVLYGADKSEDSDIKYIQEKFLIFTDALGDIKHINVLASIGSNYFTTSYFIPVPPHFNACCTYIKLAVIAPNYCPNFEYIQRELNDKGEVVDKEKPNKLFQNVKQLAYNFTTIDGRSSTVSPYSLPIIVGGTDCSEQNPEILPRCVKVKLWAGDPFTDKINIYLREANSGKWFLYETIEKHNCVPPNTKWWERTNAWDQYNYDSVTNTIEYIFCGDKECTAIDQSLFEHIENEIPFASVALAPAGDNLILSNCLKGSENLTCEQVESFSINVNSQDDEDVCEIPKREIVVYAVIKNDSYVNGYGHEVQFLFGNSSDGNDTPIDGKFWFGGMGWRKHPMTGTKKVAIDKFWKDYKQYVPAKIDDETLGGFVGYLAGTNYATVSKQVKITNCEVEDIGIIYRDISNMYKNNGSFDSIIKELKDGEYIIAQKFVFKDVDAGKYVFRIAGHRTGMTLGYEQTSSYTYQQYNLPCSTGGEFTPSIKKDYELIIDVCDYNYDSMQEGVAMQILDLTLPDFEADARNVIDYNLVSEFYLYRDSSFAIPFEQQSMQFEWGKFKDKILGIDIDIDGFEHNGTPIYLIDPLTTNILGIGVPIPCPPAPFAPFAGLLDTPSGVYSTTLRKTDHNGFCFYREHFWRWRTFFNAIPCSLFDMTAQFGEPTLGKITVNYIDECGVEDIEFTVGTTRVSPPVTALSNKGYKGLKGTGFKSVNNKDKPCVGNYITGQLLDENSKPLTGINIGYSQSQFVRTDGFGKFKLLAHNNINYDREDYFIISNSGNSCTIICVDSEDCKLCCPDTFKLLQLPPCEDCEQVDIDLGVMIFKKQNFPDRGLRGRYGVGVQGWDCFGRIVTGGVNLIRHIDVDLCWNKHPIISWNWDGLTLLPKEVKYISFFFTKNLYGKSIQWIADKFVMLDKNGNETTSRGKAVAVAVNLESLLQYNKINKFNTLSTYGFVEGDRLIILDDCKAPIIYTISGTTFGASQETAIQQELTLVSNGTTATTKTNYANANGHTIIIPFDGQIEQFLDKCNVKIEINRPYQCASEFDPYFEACCMIPVINGVPQMNYCCGGSDDSGGSGEISGCEMNVWDTYKIFRNIPVSASCVGNNPSNDPYFSNNVTDFWGEDVNSFGRIGSINPYAKRMWIQGLVMRSLSWINNGTINGLSTFWGEYAKNYDTQNFGGIQALFSYRNILGFICEFDYFIADYQVPYLKTDGDKVIVSGLNENLGNPRQKTSDRYGCLQKDTSSIVENNGTVYFYSHGRYVMTDFNSAIEISKEGVGGYFNNKHTHMNNFNNNIKNDYNNLRYCWEIISGYNPLTNSVCVTLRPRNGISPNNTSYINYEREVRINVGETIVYNANLKAWVNFRGHIPEAYGKLRTSKSGAQFFSFIHGIPYQHNNPKNGYGEIYGVKNESVIEVPINDTFDKVKIFLSSTQEIQPLSMFIDRIMTNEINSFSYLPKSYWVKKENVFYGALNRDMASYFDNNFMKESTYFEGKRIYGNYAFFRFVMNGDDVNKYFEIARFLFLLSGSELSLKPKITQPQQ